MSPAKTGLRAGPIPETTGLWAGQNRPGNRTLTRGNRPLGRPRPAWGPDPYPTQPATGPAKTGLGSGQEAETTGLWPGLYRLENRPAC